MKRPNIQLKNSKLVFVCAWCQLNTYPSLKKHQQYTHGICLAHKLKLLNKTKSYFAQHV